ncbi:DUF4268 domain-containing protein [uncultured Methanobrevibacter sp.]|uniref:DUF4268 domain-containing protein n=1 Tax=uncultured Methanobrevibacter sp. TaxID=253161 RepID=UPI0025EDDCF1|nr:DUF4268 domain-containing protein [uncultured Methanobrevibacter sp.]
MKLGKLEKVKDLRSVWKHEATDFTTWLSDEENLKILGEEIGIDIELLSTEAKTGSFSTDILAVEANTTNKIIIENQLEATDHDHLGKIITYASGHDAKTIIWIVKEAREEHRQAIDWLNEHTDEEINIFLCKIELWKIGNSEIAPKFQIVSSPNNWSKTVKRSLDNEMSATAMLQYDYWTKVKDEIDKNYPMFNSRKPRGQHWYDIAIGSSLANISLHVIARTNEIKVVLWISDSKELFDYLYNTKDEIESQLGYELEWISSENNKSSSIVIVKNTDVHDESRWDENIKWHLTKASEFYDAFSDRVKNFK